MPAVTREAAPGVGQSDEGHAGRRAFRRADGALLLALLLPIFAIFPLVQHPGLPNTADGIIHLLRQVDFDRAFRAGALVPRWGADLYGGFGYPLYIFAPPLFAYGVQAFFLTGLAMDDALKLAVIAILELYSLGMFLFMRPRTGRWGALAAAALNVYAPLRMREALVTGGNYPQFLAMALFPVVLWAFDGVLRTRWRGAERLHSTLGQDEPSESAPLLKQGASATLKAEPSRHLAPGDWAAGWPWAAAAGAAAAALVLSHLFHAMIFVPVAGSYVLLRLLLTRAPGRVWGMVLAAGALALVLSAFFWLPTLAERSLTRTAAETYIQSSDFHQRFLTWPRLLAPPLPLDFAEANADVPLALGWAQMAAAALGVGNVLIAGARTRRARRLAEPLLWLAVLGASVFLQLPASAPIWEHVSLLPVAEFPWRFMGLSAFALAALGGYAVSGRDGTVDEHDGRAAPLLRAGSRSLREVLIAGAIVLAAIVTAFPYMEPPRGFVQLGTPGPAAVLQYEQATGALGLTTINEYLPQTVLELPKDMPAPLSQAKIDLPAAQVRAALWSPFGERERVSLARAAAVRFRTFNYPGWSLSIDGMPTALTTLKDGTFTVPVPAGEHDLAAHFDETPVRMAADALSLLGVVGVAGAAVWQLAGRRRPTTRGQSQAAAGDIAMSAGHASDAEAGIAQPDLRNPHDAGAKRRERLAAAALCVALLALFMTKTFVVDPQGWMRVSRFAQPVAVFGGQMELLGGDSDAASATRGGELYVRFYWRPAQALTTDYHVFAQLIAGDGTSIAGSDKQHPGDPVVQGETPTSQIAAGTYLRDEHVIHIPSDAPPGRYELKVGLYDPKTGTRLKLPNGESMAAVGVIEVN